MVKKILKRNENLNVTIKGRPQLISLIQDGNVELEIEQYKTIDNEEDYNISFCYKGMFVSLWCNGYEIEERRTNE